MAASTGKCDRLRRCFSKFTRILNVPESHDLYDYILSIDDEHDLNEYLRGLLDDSDAGNSDLIDEFVMAWRSRSKTEDNSANVQCAKGDPKIKKMAKKKLSPGEPATFSPPRANDPSTKTPDTDHRMTSSSKTHYSPLFSEEGQNRLLVVKLPGRHRCECMATKHQLVNNCLTCGRIVCTQEGSGPCHSCGDLVCTNEEQELIDRDSKQSRQLLKKLSSQKPKKNNDKVVDETKNLQKAIDHKNMLLEFDRTVKKRTKVIDDQSDFFGVDNTWLSREERLALVTRERELNEKREAARKSTKITFDFAGRQVIEEKYNQDDDVLNEEEFLRLTANTKETTSLSVQEVKGRELPKPIYNPSGLQLGKKSSKPNSQKGIVTMRLQDSELQGMSDEGRCLSVRQPYASLLVAGLKKHEGRIWYTALRGRLWIASSSRQASEQEIRDEENTIRALNNGHKLNIPKSYPTSALLGCVNVVDCLPQEDYREQYPDGELITPYVIICENPQTLTVKFPIKGEHKIYKLDPDIHRTAKKSLKSLQ